jgi:serine/threonine protein kinase/formylglycine-generating enzyme required for sulfatase activity
MYRNAFSAQFMSPQISPFDLSQKSSDCPDDDRLTAFEYGLLDAADANQIEGHVAACLACVERLEKLVPPADFVHSTFLRVIRQPHVSAHNPPAKCSHSTKDFNASDDVVVDEKLTAALCKGVKDALKADGTEFLYRELEWLPRSNDPSSLGQLGRYRIIKILGSGGMGIVLEAVDEALHRSVAVKVMLEFRRQSAAMRSRFLREARLVASLRHSHIVTIHDIGFEDEIPYFVMEKLEGETLATLLDRRGQLPAEDVIEIALQVAGGLAYAHSQGLWHRDLKPSNIWIESWSEDVKIAKLIDFGLAIKRDVDEDGGATGELLGTPVFMSPEQAAGRVLDDRSDIFSLGCILYFAISGKIPHPGSTMTEVLQSLANTQPASLNILCPGLPRGLATLIESMLEKDPYQRPALMKEVIASLQSIQRDLRRNGRTNKYRYSAMFPVVAVSLLVFAVGVIWVAQNGVNGLFSGEMQSSNASLSTSIKQASEGESGEWFGWPVGAPKPAKAPFDEEQAKEYQQAWASYLGVPVEYVDPFGQRFNLIPPGEFLMGTRLEDVVTIQAEMQAIADNMPQENFRRNGKDMHQLLVASEYPPRRVTITEPFYLAINEITCSEWAKFAETGYLTEAERDGFGVVLGSVELLTKTGQGTSWRTNFEPSRPDRAARGISWNDVEAYANHLTQETGLAYRMPTEAEWEYACRAGTTTRYYFGDHLTHEDAEFYGAHTNVGKVWSVRSFRPNAFGIYDMHGSVAELCLDSWGVNAEAVSQTVNPVNRTESDYRVQKGINGIRVQSNRSAARIPQPTSARYGELGGRLLLSMRSVQQRVREQQK